MARRGIVSGSTSADAQIQFEPDETVQNQPPRGGQERSGAGRSADALVVSEVATVDMDFEVVLAHRVEDLGLQTSSLGKPRKEGP
jgi:hypothetical protein